MTTIITKKGKEKGIGSDTTLRINITGIEYICILFFY